MHPSVPLLEGTVRDLKAIVEPFRNILPSTKKPVMFEPYLFVRYTGRYVQLYAAPGNGQYLLAKWHQESFPLSFLLNTPMAFAFYFAPFSDLLDTLPPSLPVRCFYAQTKDSRDDRFVLESCGKPSFSYQFVTLHPQDVKKETQRIEKVLDSVSPSAVRFCIPYRAFKEIANCTRALVFNKTDRVFILSATHHKLLATDSYYFGQFDFPALSGTGDVFLYPKTFELVGRWERFLPSDTLHLSQATSNHVVISSSDETREIVFLDPAYPAAYPAAYRYEDYERYLQRSFLPVFSFELDIARVQKFFASLVASKTVLLTFAGGTGSVPAESVWETSSGLEVRVPLQSWTASDLTVSVEDKWEVPSSYLKSIGKLKSGQQSVWTICRFGDEADRGSFVLRFASEEDGFKWDCRIVPATPRTP